MPSKFSKALLAAGLAAALVGCGGGSSTTPMADGMGEDMPSDSTKQIEASYATAKSLVDALSPTSGDVQKDAAESAVNDLISLVSITVDLSAAERTEFDTNINMLLASITTNTTPEPTPPSAPPVQPTPADVRSTAWYNQLSPDTLDGLSMKWPDSNTLSGKKTPVTGLPAGWEGMDYSYSNVTATMATDEQGKTFMKNVTKMTPEITMRWDQLAKEQAKTAAGNSVIDDFLGLGGTGLKVHTFAFEPTATRAVAGGPTAAVDTSGGVDLTLSLYSTLATAPLTGALIVYDQTTELSLPEATTATSGTSALFEENDGNNVIITGFNRKDFIKMDANSLVNAPQGNANAWDIDTTTAIGSSFQYVIWKGMPGMMTFSHNNSVIQNLTARFNEDGLLELAPQLSGQLASASVVVSFTPIDFSEAWTGDNPPLLRQQLGDYDTVIVREGKTKTSVMEFAYWSSQNQASPFTVSSVDTFVREHPDMMFDDVTDMPDELTGMAKYNGLAAGYYAIGTESHGEFTADAMLTADFGTNTVSGMVDGFDSMTNDDDLSPWKLTLSAATFMDDGTFGNAFDGTTSGQSDGGGQQGSWNGQFLGKANPGTDLESAMDMTNDYPEAVIGNFTGHFAANDGHVEGAFGTELHANYKE